MMYLVVKDSEPICICGSEQNALLVAKKVLPKFGCVKVVEILSSKILFEYNN